MNCEWIPLKEITWNWDLNPRERDEDHIRDLAVHLNRDGYNTEHPIIVFLIDDEYFAATGHHRLEAADLYHADKYPNLPLKEVYCEVREGTWTDLFRCMHEDNFQHTPGYNKSLGKMPSRSDIRKMRTRLMFDPEIMGKGDRLVGSVWRCNHETVGAIRDAVIWFLTDYEEETGIDEAPAGISTEVVGYCEEWLIEVEDDALDKVHNIIKEGVYLGADGKKYQRSNKYISSENVGKLRDKCLEFFLKNKACPKDLNIFHSVSEELGVTYGNVQEVVAAFAKEVEFAKENAVKALSRGDSQESLYTLVAGPLYKKEESTRKAFWDVIYDQIQEESKDITLEFQGIDIEALTERIKSFLSKGEYRQSIYGLVIPELEHISSEAQKTEVLDKLLDSIIKADVRLQDIHTYWYIYGELYEVFKGSDFCKLDQNVDVAFNIFMTAALEFSNEGNWDVQALRWDPKKYLLDLDTEEITRLSGQYGLYKHALESNEDLGFMEKLRHQLATPASEKKQSKAEREANKILKTKKQLLKDMWDKRKLVTQDYLGEGDTDLNLHLSLVDLEKGFPKFNAYCADAFKSGMERTQFATFKACLDRVLESDVSTETLEKELRALGTYAGDVRTWNSSTDASQWIRELIHQKKEKEAKPKNAKSGGETPPRETESDSVPEETSDVEGVVIELSEIDFTGVAFRDGKKNYAWVAFDDNAPNAHGKLSDIPDELMTELVTFLKPYVEKQLNAK